MGKAELTARIQTLADDAHTVANVIDGFLDRYSDLLDGAAAVWKADLLRSAATGHKVAGEFADAAAVLGGRGVDSLPTTPGADR